MSEGPQEIRISLWITVDLACAACAACASCALRLSSPAGFISKYCMFKCSSRRKVGSRHAANGNVLPPFLDQLGHAVVKSMELCSALLCHTDLVHGCWMPSVSFLFDLLVAMHCFILMWHSSKGSKRELVWLGCQSCIEAPSFYLPTRPAYSAAEFTSQGVKIRWGKLGLEKPNRSKIQDIPR